MNTINILSRQSFILNIFTQSFYSFVYCQRLYSPTFSLNVIFHLVTVLLLSCYCQQIPSLSCFLDQICPPNSMILFLQSYRQDLCLFCSLVCLNNLLVQTTQFWKLLYVNYCGILLWSNVPKYLFATLPKQCIISGYNNHVTKWDASTWNRWMTGPKYPCKSQVTMVERRFFKKQT